MELRQGEAAVRQDGDWDAQDVAEYNGVKQIGILVGISPVLAGLSMLLSSVFPTSSPIFRTVAFMVALVPLVAIGTWAAGMASRHWQVEVKPLAAPSSLAAGRFQSDEPTNYRRLLVAGNWNAYRAARSTKATSVLARRARPHGPARPPAPRPVS
jgi:hypothetical protein